MEDMRTRAEQWMEQEVKGENWRGRKMREELDEYKGEEEQTDSKLVKQINNRGQRQTSNKQAFLCWVIIPGVPAAGLEQVADAIVVGVSGDQRRCLCGEVVGGDALQARDFQSEAHRAQAGRRQTLQHTKTTLKQSVEETNFKQHELIFWVTWGQQSKHDNDTFSTYKVSVVVLESNTHYWLNTTTQYSV